MKNIFLMSIFVGAFLFPPAHSAIANTTNLYFDADEDGVIDSPPWFYNELVSLGGPESVLFSADSRDKEPPERIHDSFLWQRFTIDYGSLTLSFSGTIGNYAETGVFTATLDGLNFFTISSEDIPSGENHLDFTCSPLDISDLWGQEVELYFNLNNDYSGLSSEFDSFVVLSNLNISTNAQVVPVPGAIALGGIGVAFVGWLRRRRTL